MVNLIKFSIFISLALLLSSCKKNESECVKVKFVTAYCPKKGAVLVTIESQPGSSNQIALLNVPVSFQVMDKVFYVKYHYDASLDKLDDGVFCPAIFAPVKIYIIDSVSDTNCN